MVPTLAEMVHRDEQAAFLHHARGVDGFPVVSPAMNRRAADGCRNLPRRERLERLTSARRWKSPFDAVEHQWVTAGRPAGVDRA
jgi:hypothetical protein